MLFCLASRRTPLCWRRWLDFNSRLSAAESIADRTMDTLWSGSPGEDNWLGSPGRTCGGTAKPVKKIRVKNSLIIRPEQSRVRHDQSQKTMKSCSLKVKQSFLGEICCCTGWHYLKTFLIACCGSPEFIGKTLGSFLGSVAHFWLSVSMLADLAGKNGPVNVPNHVWLGWSTSGATSGSAVAVVAVGRACHAVTSWSGAESTNETAAAPSTANNQLLVVGVDAVGPNISGRWTRVSTPSWHGGQKLGRGLKKSRRNNALTK